MSYKSLRINLKKTKAGHPGQKVRNSYALCVTVSQKYRGHRTEGRSDLSGRDKRVGNEISSERIFPLIIRVQSGTVVEK